MYLLPRPEIALHNQTWKVYSSGIDLFDFNLFIYNRWGEIVWESHDASVGWDGTYQGKKVQNGTYTWKIDCGDATNDSRHTFIRHIVALD